MHLDDLILFSHVAELGSFVRAAEKSDLANSVVSKRISRLEAHLGVQLFYRTTRKLTLTEAGMTLRQRAKNIEIAAAEAMDSISGLGETMTGHIKMSVPTISGDLLIAEAVAEFCQQHPGLTVDMSLENRFVDLIEGGYDLVIRTGYLEDSSLIARRFLESNWIVCASPKYLKQYGSPTNPIDLQQHNCLQYTYHTSGASEWEFKSETGNYMVKVAGSFFTDNAAALRKTTLAGYGIAYVPRCLVYTDLQNNSLVDLFPTLVAKKVGIYAVYPFTKQAPKKIRLLVEHIRQRYLDMAHYF
ncbi:LysR family transcriptional regulator [Agarilytica rhodophyticola]|uniref:LysR family transcriptional regulator n=1 Tax=Agarilytica rhodophyticola TaxID=1737490 RepID=UPI000B342DE2|nr:LysR family transcriptional regulator [Agarilytica rhodophyticola]